VVFFRIHVSPLLWCVNGALCNVFLLFLRICRRFFLLGGGVLLLPGFHPSFRPNYLYSPFQSFLFCLLFSPPSPFSVLVGIFAISRCGPPALGLFFSSFERASFIRLVWRGLGGFFFQLGFLLWLVEDFGVFVFLGAFFFFLLFFFVFFALGRGGLSSPRCGGFFLFSREGVLGGVKFFFPWSLSAWGVLPSFLLVGSSHTVFFPEGRVDPFFLGSLQVPAVVFFCYVSRMCPFLCRLSFFWLAFFFSVTPFFFFFPSSFSAGPFLLRSFF